MVRVKPLVVDADGALLRTSIVAESFWHGLGQDPEAVFRALARVARPAAFRAALARAAVLRADLLPVHPEVLELAKSSRAVGRDVILVSRADRGVVARLAAAHGLSPDVVAELSDEARRRAVIERFGAAGFDYVGSDPGDRQIWDAAENAYIVGRRAGLSRTLTEDGHSVTGFSGGWRIGDLARALRPHQWVKNVLLFVPMIAAHAFTLSNLLTVLLGIVAFSAAASSIYIVNDLLDLEADRRHPTKHRRPFASGKVPIGVGSLAGLGLAGLALAMAAWLGPVFLGVTLLYMAISTAYSLRLKRLRWIDIGTLAALYSVRVVAGAAAVDVPVSGYLLAFIYPVFLTLGCVKRITEVTLAETEGRLPGRGYGKSDRDDLLNVAVLGMAGALVTFFLYTLSDQARALYSERWLLWLAMVPLGFWLLRMIRYGYVGRQDYDPIVFAMRDPRGIGLVLIVLSLMFYAAGLWPWG